MFSPSPKNGATFEHRVFSEQDEKFLCGFVTYYSTIACMDISQIKRIRFASTFRNLYLGLFAMLLFPIVGNYTILLRSGFQWRNVRTKFRHRRLTLSQIQTAHHMNTICTKLHENRRLFFL